MEREQIVKALECCANCCCENCPTKKFGATCVGKLIKYALALIKELIEENERLRVEKETLEICEKDLRFRNKEFQKANEGLAKNCEDLECQLQLGCEIKADTVRKMQERLHELFSDRAAYTASHCHEVIDRIADEMLEGEK